MKKYIALSLLSAVAFLTACKKDATPAPSANVADAFIRTDNAANPADHQIYLLYKQTGVPVLYSDTVQRSPLTLLNIGYHITSIDSLVTATYLQNNDDILAGVNFVQDQVLPALGTGLRPYSVLLTDSLYTFQYSYLGKQQVILNAYLGLQALVIGNVSAIKTLSPDALKVYKKDIFKNLLTVKFNQNDAVLKDFYAVSAAFYGKYAYGTDFTQYYIPAVAKENYGLLSNGTESPYGYPVDTDADDLAQYLNILLVLSTDEFTAKYGSYPLVMEKYNLFKTALTALQFKLPS